jgi:diguanylate cyclase
MVRLRPASLSARLILLVTLAVLPVTAAILYAGLEQRRRVSGDVEREALALARAVASEKDRLVIQTHQILTILAHVPQVRAADPVECDGILAAVMGEGRRYVNMGVATPDGMIRCSALPIAGPVDASSRSWFVRATASGDFAVGDFQVGSITGIRTINFGYPIHEADSLAGVIFAALPLTWLQERLATADLHPGSEILVADGTATVLARYPEREDWVGRSFAGAPLAEAILAHPDEAIAVRAGLDGVNRLYATVHLHDDPAAHTMMVSVGIPTQMAYAPVEAAMARSLLVLALALALGAGATWWSSRSLVLKPHRRLLLAIDRLRGGDLAARASVRGAPREIEQLGDAFNEMAVTLQQRMGEVRDHLEQISRLNRVRAVLSGINSAILRIRDRDELLREVCRISVREGSFALAWVAELDPSGGEVRVAASAASPGAQVDAPVPELLRSERGIAAAALRRGTEVIVNGPGSRTPGPGGDEQYLAPGFRSAAALPLRIGDRIVAALSLYTREAGFFTREEVRLLRELTADASLGLEYLEKEKQLHYLANYDPLTDLPNRALFNDHLRQAIGSARQEGRLAAVLLVGVEHFSEINATLGQQAGDRVLREIADRLRQAVGEANTAARLGSRDFGVVCAEASSVRDLERFADDLLGALPRVVSVGEEPIFLSLRIGIAAFPHDGDEPDQLIKGAALALEAAGSVPDHPIAFYSAALNVETRRRRKLEQELRAALERDELTLHYQPLVDLATREPIGMEALLRWHSPSLGDVPPAVFIPLAEEMGIMRQIGEWVLATAAREGRRLHDEGLTELRMNVNVSVSQLRDPLYVENFMRIVAETGIDLGRLGLGIEVTESELMENVEHAAAALENFREMGLWIYIDDFGTGYSSLSYLRLLPLDSLKIDRSFIRDIPAKGEAVAIVKSIVALARSLDLRVIAEGVETEQQLSTLRELGCKAGQGFLFSRPLPADELEIFLSGRT